MVGVESHSEKNGDTQQSNPQNLSTGTVLFSLSCHGTSIPEAPLDGLPHVVHQPLPSGRASVICRDRLAHNNFDLPRGHLERTSRQHLPASPNRNRDDGYAGLHGQGESAFFEGMNLPIRTSSPLRKHQHRGPFPDSGHGSLNTSDSFLPSPAINTDVSRCPHGPSDDGDFKDLFPGNPFEIDGQARQENKNVKGSLMIRHKDVRPSRDDLILPRQTSADAAALDNQPAPRASVPVNDHSLTIKGKSQIGQNGKGGRTGNQAEQSKDGP